MSEPEQGVGESGSVDRASSVVPKRSWWAQMPRWVRVFAVVAAVVLILVGVMLLSGHGPGQHGLCAGRCCQPGSLMGVAAFDPA